MASGVSTVGQTNNLLFSTRKSQETANKTIEQITSGRDAALYSEKADESKSLVNFENQYEWSTQQILRAKRTDINLQKAETAINSILTTAKKLYSDTISVNNGSKPDNHGFNLLAQVAFDEIVYQLNVRDDESNYLFAGSRTDQPAVDATLIPAQTSPSTADFTYYKGNSVTSLVTADHPSFEKLLRAAKMAATVNMTGVPDPTTLGEIGDLLSDGIKDLSDGPFTTIALKRGDAERDQAQAEEDQIRTQVDASQIISTNLYEKFIRSQQTQLQLEASYNINAQQTKLVRNFIDRILG